MDVHVKIHSLNKSNYSKTIILLTLSWWAFSVTILKKRNQYR